VKFDSTGEFLATSNMSFLQVVSWNSEHFGKQYGSNIDNSTCLVNLDWYRNTIAWVDNPGLEGFRVGKALIDSEGKITKENIIEKKYNFGGENRKLTVVPFSLFKFLSDNEFIGCEMTYFCVGNFQDESLKEYYMDDFSITFAIDVPEKAEVRDRDESERVQFVQQDERAKVKKYAMAIQFIGEQKIAGLSKLFYL